MHTTAAWMEKGGTRSEYRVVPTLRHPLGPAAWRFWEQRPGDGIVIGRDVPSRAIAKLLSNVLVYRPVDEGRDYAVQVAGDGIRRRFPDDITGKRQAELFSPEEHPVRFRTIKDAQEQNEPRMASISHSSGSLEILHVELLILPALSPDRSENWPLVFCFYF